MPVQRTASVPVAMKKHLISISSKLESPGFWSSVVVIALITSLCTWSKQLLHHSCCIPSFCSRKYNRMSWQMNILIASVSMFAKVISIKTDKTYNSYKHKDTKLKNCESEQSEQYYNTIIPLTIFSTTDLCTKSKGETKKHSVAHITLMPLMRR